MELSSAETSSSQINRHFSNISHSVYNQQYLDVYCDVSFVCSSDCNVQVALHAHLQYRLNA